MASNQTMSISTARKMRLPDPQLWAATTMPGLQLMIEGKVTSLQKLQEIIQSYQPRCDSVGGLFLAIASLPGDGSRFYAEILPTIATYASQIFATFPSPASVPNVALQGVRAEIELTHHDATVLLATMVLCTVTIDTRDFQQLDMPWTQNFTEMFGNSSQPEVAKLTCFLHYFERMRETAASTTATVTFSRHQLSPTADEAVTAATAAAGGPPPKWGAVLPSKQHLPLRPVELHGDGVIADADPAVFIHADFANEYIGGGVLCGGCVQEEILFAVAPLHTVTLLLFPRMLEHESIVMRGCEQFAASTGYGWSLQYAGDFRDPTARDANGAVITRCVAIDAIPYGDGRGQWRPELMSRDLLKAYSGFAIPGTQTGISTGNWGCGAFGGDLHLKCLLQWEAASAAGRSMKYYTFHEGDPNLVPEFTALATDAVARGCTVGDLHAAIFDAAKGFKSRSMRRSGPPRKGRRISGEEMSPTATKKTLFGSDGGGGGGGGGSSDDDGPSVPPVDLDVLDAEIKLRDGGTSWQYLHSVVRAKLLPAVVNTVGSE